MSKELEIESLKGIAKGAGIVFAGMFLSKFLMYAYRLIVARIGTEEYGLLSLGFAVVGIVGTIALLGLNSGVLRYISYYRGKKDNKKIKSIINSSLKISLPFGILLSILLFFSSEWISINIFNNPNLIPVLKIFSITIPFYAGGLIFLAALQAFKKIEYVVGIKNVLENLIKVFGVVLAYFLGWELFRAAIYSYTLAIVFTFIVSWFFLKKKTFSILAKVKETKFRTKELVSYSWPLMFTGILLMVLSWTDTLMIGYFKTASDVGIYNAALPTAALLSIVPLSFLGLFIPITTRLLARNKEKELEKVCKTTSKWIFFINLPVFLLFILFSKQILSILFGFEYAAGYLAMSILAVGYFSFSVFYLTIKILEVIKKTRLILINTLVTTATNISLNLYLIPIYGIIGGAIATATSFILFGFLGFAGTYHFKRINPINRNYLKSVIAGLISIMVVYKLDQLLFISASVYTLFLITVVFSATYLILLILFKGFEKEDIEIIRMIERKVGFNFITNQIIKK